MSNIVKKKRNVRTQNVYHRSQRACLCFMPTLKQYLKQPFLELDWQTQCPKMLFPSLVPFWSCGTL